jgi:hypothetical protein
MLLAAALCALFLSVCAFLMAGGTLIYVLARRFSTVEIRQVPVETGETIYETEDPRPTGDLDAPKRPPVSLTSAEHEKFERLRQLEARFEEAVESDDYSFGLQD